MTKKVNEEIARNRLWNFRRILRSVGGTNKAAELLGKTNSQVTQFGSPNPNRTIGDSIANHIERAFGLEPGSLDQPPPVESRDPDPIIAEINAVLVNVTDEDKETFPGDCYMAHPNTFSSICLFGVQLSKTGEVGRIGIGEADLIKHGTTLANELEDLANAIRRKTESIQETLDAD